jgi:hypothetical protein
VSTLGDEWGSWDPSAQKRRIECVLFAYRRRLLGEALSEGEVACQVKKRVCAKVRV